MRSAILWIFFLTFVRNYYQNEIVREEDSSGQDSTSEIITTIAYDNGDGDIKYAVVGGIISVLAVTAGLVLAGNHFCKISKKEKNNQ